MAAQAQIFLWRLRHPLPASLSADEGEQEESVEVRERVDGGGGRGSKLSQGNCFVRVRGARWFRPRR